jgi:hypothetical protein
MIVFLVSALTAAITALVCIIMVMQDYRHAMRICERERRRGEWDKERLRAPIREHAAAQGVDIEDLLILCGAEGWSDGRAGKAHSGNMAGHSGPQPDG